MTYRLVMLLRQLAVPRIQLIKTRYQVSPILIVSVCLFFFTLCFMQNTSAGAGSTHSRQSTAFWGGIASVNSFGQTPAGNADRVGVRIVEEKDWQVYNLFPSGHLEVFHREEFNWHRLNLPASWRRDTYTLLTIPSNELL